MGLYNMVFGVSKHAPIVLALLDRAPSTFGRFRDAWLEKTAARELRLVVYTRNGGANREEEMPDFSHDPLYISDRDDDFDSTYATIYFRMPAELPAEVLRQITDSSAPERMNTSDKFRAMLLGIALEPVDMSERWKQAINSIEAGDVHEC